MKHFKVILTKLITAAALAFTIGVTAQPTGNTQTVQAAKMSKKEKAAKKWIAMRESGGNYQARNGVCYGKYQLNISYLHGDLSKKNQDKTADAYVYGRYGSWVNAKAFWLTHNWY